MKVYLSSKNKNFNGKILGLFFMIIFSFRFLIEFLKEHQSVLLSTGSINHGAGSEYSFYYCRHNTLYESNKRKEIKVCVTYLLYITINSTQSPNFLITFTFVMLNLFPHLFSDPEPIRGGGQGVNIVFLYKQNRHCQIQQVNKHTLINNYCFSYICLMDIAISLIIGICLAAACGFRVFVPLLISGIASQAGYLELSSSYLWIESVPAIIAFSVATLLEILGYYIPWVDNMLDTIATPLAPIAGVIASVSFDNGCRPAFQMDFCRDNGRWNSDNSSAAYSKSESSILFLYKRIW